MREGRRREGKTTMKQGKANIESEGERQKISNRRKRVE